MKKGETVKISPDLTNRPGWIDGKVIEVENNSFVGTVIVAQTAEGLIFFGPLNRFKPCC